MLHLTATTYSTRPSELVAISSRVVALDFDLAVAQFGITVNNRISETDSKGRPKRSLKSVLARMKPKKDLVRIPANIRSLPGVLVKFVDRLPGR